MSPTTEELQRITAILVRIEKHILAEQERRQKEAARWLNRPMGIIGTAGPELFNPGLVFAQLHADLNGLKPRSWWQRCLQWLHLTGPVYSAREQELARRSGAQHGPAARSEGLQ